MLDMNELHTDQETSMSLWVVYMKYKNKELVLLAFKLHGNSKQQ